MTSVRDIAQPGLARLTGGQKVRSSNLRIPTIFFALKKLKTPVLSFFYSRAKKHEVAILSLIYSLIQQVFTEYLLQVSGTVLCEGDTELNKTEMILAFLDLTVFRKH